MVSLVDGGEGEVLKQSGLLVTKSDVIVHCPIIFEHGLGSSRRKASSVTFCGE